MSVSPSILTSQGQGYGSRPHSCLFEPYKPLILNTAQFVLHNLHHSKWLHLAPQAIRDTFLHPTPSLARSVRLFPESWSGPRCSGVLVSSSFRPLLGSLPRPTSGRCRLFSNSLLSHYAAITYGFPNQPVTSQGARMGSCLSPNLQFAGGGGKAK